MTTTIKLLPVHCKLGVPGSFNECPHALAIKCEYPSAIRVWVRLTNVSIFFRNDDKSVIEFTAPLPYNVRDHIANIDQLREGEKKRPLRPVLPISYPLHFSKELVE